MAANLELIVKAMVQEATKPLRDLANALRDVQRASGGAGYASPQSAAASATRATASAIKQQAAAARESASALARQASALNQASAALQRYNASLSTTRRILTIAGPRPAAGLLPSPAQLPSARFIAGAGGIRDPGASYGLLPAGYRQTYPSAPPRWLPGQPLPVGYPLMSRAKQNIPYLPSMNVPFAPGYGVQPGAFSGRRYGAALTGVGGLFGRPGAGMGLVGAAGAMQGAFGAIGKGLSFVRDKFKGAGKAKDDFADNTKKKSPAFRQFANSFVQMGSRIRQSFEDTFLRRGFLGAITASLFAPLSFVRRGLQSFSTAFVQLTQIFRGGVFQAVPNLFNVLGNVMRGVGDIAAGLISQFGRLVALPLDVFAAVTRSFGSVGKVIGGLTGAVGKLAGVFGDVAGEITAVFGRLLGGMADIVAAGLRPVAAAFDFLVSPITTVFGLLQMAWRFSLVAMLGAAAWFTKSAVSSFVEFERKVTQIIVQIPHAGRDAFEQFGEIAMNLSRRLGKSASEITEALRLAVSVGFEDVAEATEVATQAVRLATASFSDIRTATEAVTNIMNSYGLAAREAGRVTDLLQAGWQVAGGDMQDYAHGVGMIGSAVAATGATIEDLIGVTALLSRSAAGNSRIFIEAQQAFQQLVAPGGKAAELLGRLGIEWTRNSRGGLDFLRTVTSIEKRLDEISGGDRIKKYRLLQQIFPDERERRALARFFEAAGASIDEVFRAVRQPGGAVGGALEDVNKRFFRQIEIMKATFERLRIAIGGKLKSLLQPAIESMNQFFQKLEGAARGGRFDAFFESVKRLFAAFTGAKGDLSIADVLIDLFERRLPPLIDQLTEQVKKAAGWVRDFMAAFDWDLLKADFYDFLADMVDKINGALGSFGMPSLEEITTEAKRIADEIAQWDVAAFIASVRDGVSAMMDMRDVTLEFVEGLGVGLKRMGNIVRAAQAFVMIIAGATKEDIEQEQKKSIWSILFNMSGAGAGMSLLGFQHGGVVPGSGSGDRVPAWLEPGELVVPKSVLRRRQSGLGMQAGGFAADVRGQAAALRESAIARQEDRIAEWVKREIANTVQFQVAMGEWREAVEEFRVGALKIQEVQKAFARVVQAAAPAAPARPAGPAGVPGHAEGVGAGAMAPPARPGIFGPAQRLRDRIAKQREWNRAQGGRSFRERDQERAAREREMVDRFVVTGQMQQV